MKKGNIEEFRGFVVGSLDANALYPSLDVPSCCKIASQKVMESEVKFSDFDVEWAAI